MHVFSERCMVPFLFVLGVLRVFGVWQSMSASAYFHVWQIVCLIAIAIAMGLPLSLFMSSIYTTNRVDAMKTARLDVYNHFGYQMYIDCFGTKKKNEFQLDELLTISHEMDSHVEYRSHNAKCIWKMSSISGSQSPYAITRCIW